MADSTGANSVLMLSLAKRVIIKYCQDQARIHPAFVTPGLNPGQLCFKSLQALNSVAHRRQVLRRDLMDLLAAQIVLAADRKQLFDHRKRYSKVARMPHEPESLQTGLIVAALIPR